jgi:ABC-type multidrug transport system fused ATPase/permease subunit
MGSVLGNLALDIDFGDFLWSLVIIFFMIIFFVILFQVVFDLFRDHELSGWAKAGWLIFIIVLPFLGLFVYLIARGPKMAERAQRDQQASRQAMDEYIRSTAAGGGPAAELAQAKALLDSGAITQEEFDALKKKTLG